MHDLNKILQENIDMILHDYFGKITPGYVPNSLVILHENRYVILHNLASFFLQDLARFFYLGIVRVKYFYILDYVHNLFAAIPR